MKKFKADGADGLAHALTEALLANTAPVHVMPKRPNVGKTHRAFINEASEIPQEVFDKLSTRMADDGNMVIYGGGQGAGRRHQVQGVSSIFFGESITAGPDGILFATNADGKHFPDPVAQRKVREEQAKRISKLSAIVKRAEPRLLMELLQDFGSIEGLNAKRQADLIQRLEGIRKEYGI